MSDQSEPTTSSNSALGSVRRFIEPAIIIAIVSAILYYFSWTYYESYFMRLGVQHPSLDLPPTFYLTGAFPGIILAMSVFAAISLASRQKPKTLFEAVIGNVGLYLFAGFLAYALTQVSDPGIIRYRIAAVIITFIGATLFSWKRISLHHLIWEGDPVDRIVATALVMIVALSSVYTAGTLVAGQSIQRNAFFHPVSIEFTLKGGMPSELQGKDLMLIIHRDGKYFVTPFEQPAPGSPKAFIIGDDQIELVATQVL